MSGEHRRAIKVVVGGSSSLGRAAKALFIFRGLPGWWVSAKREKNGVPAKLAPFCIPAPALSETRTAGEYRTCSIARSLRRGLSDMYDTPPNATLLRSARRSGSAGRPRAAVKPLALQCGVRDRVLQVSGRVLAPVAQVPNGHEGAPALSRYIQLDLAGCGKVRRGVGRQARQSRGEFLRSDKYLSLPPGYKSAVCGLYPHSDQSRTIGRLCCSIDRRLV